MLPGERPGVRNGDPLPRDEGGCPAPLWSPMLEPTPADARREDIIASTETLTDAVTTYLTGPC